MSLLRIAFAVLVDLEAAGKSAVCLSISILRQEQVVRERKCRLIHDRT